MWRRTSRCGDSSSVSRHDCAQQYKQNTVSYPDQFGGRIFSTPLEAATRTAARTAAEQQPQRPQTLKLRGSSQRAHRIKHRTQAHRHGDEDVALEHVEPPVLREHTERCRARAHTEVRKEASPFHHSQKFRTNVHTPLRRDVTQTMGANKRRNEAAREKTGTRIDREHTERCKRGHRTRDRP
jgi:hypothetical protein